MSEETKLAGLTAVAFSLCGVLTWIAVKISRTPTTIIRQP